MYKLCVTEKSAKNQVQLEEAFLRLALQRNYDDITISDICREAGLSRKVYYRLFEGKNDVLYALIDHALGGFEAYEPEMEPLRRFLLLGGAETPAGCSGPQPVQRAADGPGGSVRSDLQPLHSAGDLPGSAPLGPGYANLFHLRPVRHDAGLARPGFRQFC